MKRIVVRDGVFVKTNPEDVCSSPLRFSQKTGQNPPYYSLWFDDLYFPRFFLKKELPIYLDKFFKRYDNENYRRRKRCKK